MRRFDHPEAITPNYPVCRNRPFRLAHLWPPLRFKATGAQEDPHLVRSNESFFNTIEIIFNFLIIDPL